MKIGKHTESFHLMTRMAWVVLAIGCGGNVSLGSQEEDGGAGGSGGAKGNSSVSTDSSDRDAAADAPVITGGSTGQGSTGTGTGQGGGGEKGGASVAGGSVAGGSLASGGSSATGTAGAGGTTASGGTSGTPSGVTLTASFDGKIRATWRNQMDQSIFLYGCGTVNWSRLENSGWVNHGAFISCAVEGVAIEVLAGATFGESGSVNAAGTYRLSGQYGVGCTPGLPLSRAGCKNLYQAVSNEITVSIDAGVAPDGSAGTGGTGGAGGSGGSGGAKDAGSQPADAQTGNCRALTTQAACEARTDCHAVFEDPNDCVCDTRGLTPGCCARFSVCADGGHANCSGTVSCEINPPYCAGQYTVSYTSGCYEGCVKSAVCASDAGTAGGSYPTAYLAWEAPGGAAGTGPALVASGEGWLNTWNNIPGFVKDTPEKAPSGATGTTMLSRTQADDLFSRLAAVNASVLPHPSSVGYEIYPYLYYRLCSTCKYVTLSYKVAAQLSPEMEPVWLWFDQLLGATVSTNPRNWGKVP